MACANEELPYLGIKGAMADDIHVLSIEDVNQHSSSRHGGTYGCAYSGVRIREFDGGNVNPEPERRDEEDAESLWEDFLSPNKLKTISGVNNLDIVTFLEMQVNTNEHSLGNFGGMLPNLSQLKLSNSVISTVRDLGTSLPNLKTLWLSRCGLTDLDGISSIPYLMELYVAFNDISDVSPVSMLDNLEVLDLEGNLIDDLSQVEFLTLCSTLKSLNLEGNPVCVAPHPNSTAQEMAGYEYRQAIHHAVPGLKILDDEPFLVEKVDGKNVLRDMPDSAKCIKVPNHLKDEWQLINDGLKAVENEQEEDEAAKSSPAPRASSAWSSTRPKTAMARPRPSSASRQRPGSAIGQRPGSAIGQRPGSSLGSSGSQSDLSGIFQGDDSSDLTHGCSEVICGNISKALKSRRKNIQNVKLAVLPFSNNLHTPEKSYEEEAGDSPSKDDVLEELKQWRQQFAKFVDEDHSLPTSIETESSQSESESPSSSPRRNEAFESSPSPPYCRTSLTPSPPPPSMQRSRPSAMRRSLPIAPLVGRDLQRPHTSGEFRIRRYRQASTENNIDNLRALKQENDVDVNKNELKLSLESRSPPSSLAVLESEARSSSAPVRATTRYRVLPSTPPDTRTNSQSTDECPLPAGQSSISSVSHGYRPGTAAAALQKRRLKPSRKS